MMWGNKNNNIDISVANLNEDPLFYEIKVKHWDDIQRRWGCTLARDLACIYHRGVDLNAFIKEIIVDCRFKQNLVFATEYIPEWPRRYYCVKDTIT